MEITLEHANDLDIILAFICKDASFHSASEVHEKLFPNSEHHYVTYLFDLLINFYAPQIVREPSNQLKKDKHISKNSSTQYFLNNGGFTSKFEQAKKQTEIENEKQSLEIQQLKTNVSLLTNQLVDYDKTKKQAKWAIGISIFIAVLEGFKLFYELLNKH